jgi:hypothetical protein
VEESRKLQKRLATAWKMKQSFAILLLAATEAVKILMTEIQKVRKGRSHPRRKVLAGHGRLFLIQRVVQVALGHNRNQLARGPSRNLVTRGPSRRAHSQTAMVCGHSRNLVTRGPSRRAHSQMAMGRDRKAAVGDAVVRSGAFNYQFCLL